MKILLYSTQISTRLSYIIDFFSKQINDEIIITNDADLFQQTDAIKINYSSSSVTQRELWIQPHALLFENNIQQQKAECFQWNDLKFFFKSGGDIPFDIFSASFYLLARYEEYLPHEKDMYSRYAHPNSLAFKEDFLHLPLINLWIEEFKKMLKQKFSTFKIYHSSFTFLPTYDIDIAYAFRNHPFLKNTLGLSKDLGTANFKSYFQRFFAMIGLGGDPFDTYQWLDELHVKYNLQPYYFFLLAENRKGYDKNLSPYTNAMQGLIKTHNAKYSVGIHPSWQSGDDENILKKEISIFKNITGKAVTMSRQHYIRMTLPQTYRLLIDNQIKNDFSMGYGSINGFRASVASSFCWYDLEKEEQTPLLVHPFCFMEANSYFEQHYTAKQAAAELQQYHDVIKSVDGDLITIFHNHFVTEQKEWLPWRNMYADFLKRNFG
ncbi:hypothetical protein FRZ67_07140 [Panacibacter ginsenosidivorans]|uniref:DUF7033 domain-containing protein n=1 Tax=Panacibacter ginsenosidivorans TaxID=1813871 RepID=A0A5B8V843_9BACT|nr:polysaccharide deacetylase family protein [Panacibacter ginsenosidivorans]QEC67073.1 hypothetical protein FRZ67_07140 [Panacibacter ginsenosidivorans]